MRRGIYFIADKKLMLADVQTQPVFKAGPLREIFEVLRPRIGSHAQLRRDARR
jgi:hypothetical protein